MRGKSTGTDSQLSLFISVIALFCCVLVLYMVVHTKENTSEKDLYIRLQILLKGAGLISWNLNGI